MPCGETFGIPWPKQPPSLRRVHQRGAPGTCNIPLAGKCQRIEQCGGTRRHTLPRGSRRHRLSPDQFGSSGFRSQYRRRRLLGEDRGTTHTANTCKHEILAGSCGHTRNRSGDPLASAQEIRNLKSATPPLSLLTPSLAAALQYSMGFTVSSCRVQRLKFCHHRQTVYLQHVNSQPSSARRLLCLHAGGERSC